MKGLFRSETFAGFGPAGLSLASEPVAITTIRGRRSGLLRQGVREQAPRLPGVYGMLDATGELIYAYHERGFALVSTPVRSCSWTTARSA